MSILGILHALKADELSILRSLPQEPRYGYLVVAVVLLIWLVGVICGWKWTYSRPGSTGGNFWMNLLGPKTFRFWLGVILTAGIGLALYLFTISGK